MARDGESRREKIERKEEVVLGKHAEKSKRHHSDDDIDDSDDDNNTKSGIDSDDEHRHHSKKKEKKHSHSHSSSSHKKKRRRRRRYSDTESETDTDTEESDSEESESDTSSEERRRGRRKRKERKRREKERKKRKRRDDDSDSDSDSGKRKSRKKKKKDKKKGKKKKEDKKEKGKVGAVTNSWGKYGVVREVDMWNKRPEFTAWLAEVKQVNLESLSNWEEKKMFKEYMEDYNTATFPSKKYYDLDLYHRQKLEKQMKQGLKKVVETERTVFNDEEQRRKELLQVREKQKEQEVEALKNAMKSGMAQDMKEQARLKEEMAYLFKIGNNEAAAAIQRKLDPDVPM